MTEEEIAMTETVTTVTGMMSETAIEIAMTEVAAHLVVVGVVNTVPLTTRNTASPLQIFPPGAAGKI